MEEMKDLRKKIEEWREEEGWRVEMIRKDWKWIKILLPIVIILAFLIGYFIGIDLIKIGF